MEDIMETLLPILTQLISGAAGGNAAGAAIKDKSLGTAGNSIAGLIGGGIGGVLLNNFGNMAGGSDLLSMITGNTGGLAGAIGSLSSSTTSVLASSAGAGGVGGAVLMLVIAIARQYLAKR